jgi:hypothetical protein
VNRNKLNLVVDVLAYLCMVALASTGLLLLYRLPPGTDGRHGGKPALTLLGLGRHDWGGLHFYIAVALLLLVVLHIALHWQWVKHTLGSLCRRRAVQKPGTGHPGAVSLIVLGLVGACLVAAPWLLVVQQAQRGERGSRHGNDSRVELASYEPDARDPHGAMGRSRGADPGHVTEPQAERSHEEHDHSITGRTTLAEAAHMAGVPVQQFLAELNLPVSTSPAEQLGRLRREHDLTMTDLRAAVTRLKDIPGHQQ